MDVLYGLEVSVEDRILWKKDPAMKCLTYDSVPSLQCSDHRPVFAQFEALKSIFAVDSYLRHVKRQMYISIHI